MTADPELVKIISDALDDALGFGMQEPHRRDASQRLADALAPHVVMRSQYAVLNESAVDASSRAFESARKAVAAEARVAELQSALAEWDAEAARWEDQIRALKHHVLNLFHDGEPRQDGTQPTLQLTELGKLAYRYGALTPPQWWKDLFDEVKQLADEDADYDVLFEERIAGLREIHQNVHKLIASDGTQHDR